MYNQIYLPLYSSKGGIHVQERSGLNQWRANGRDRDCYEVYIPIPKEVNNKFPNFFPGRETTFNLILPNMEILIAKICQDGNKALMSNPNSSLGRWIIGEIEKNNESLLQNGRELITYEMLENSGFDSVLVTKIDDYTYIIETAPIGSYERQMRR